MKASEVLELLKISRSTLTKYIQEGYITGSISTTGRYEYDSDSVYEFMKNNPITLHKKVIAYVRWLTDENEEHIEEQFRNIKQYARENKIKITDKLYDINNGYTLNRENLKQIIIDVCNYNVSQIIINNNDILSITDFDTIKELFLQHNCEIVSLDTYNLSDKDKLEELNSVINNTQDKLSIVKFNKKLDLIQQDIKLYIK